MQNTKKGRRATDEAGQFSSLIGPSSCFEGVITGNDNCIVYGRFEGECLLDGTLVLGEHGHFIGDIKAPSVIISGQVDGDIEASEKLELTATARVNGCVRSPVLAMSEGAQHVGEIIMRKESEVTRFKEKREQGDL